MDEREREKIELTEFEIAPILYEYACEDDEYSEFYDEDGEIIGNPIWNQFEIVEDNMIDYDLDKCYEFMEVIVQRKSDKKYFKGEYVQSSYRGNEYEAVLIEVFPRIIEKVIYE